LVRKSLTTLSLLLGKEVNIESGEEPGKCVHEWRPSGHEHLTKHATPPWFIYPEGGMKNYDTADATALFLIAMHEYAEMSGDHAFIEQHLAHIEAALGWLTTFGDSNKDGFIDYGFHEKRTYGGLKTQSWMDSAESLFHDDGSIPRYPVAPIEVQGYAFAAFMRWSKFFELHTAFAAPHRAAEYAERALDLKRRFNEQFVLDGKEGKLFPFAIDGEGRPLLAPRSSVGHLLWAAYEGESVLDEVYIPEATKMLVSTELFVRGAGIRTLSSASPRYAPQSYHNGSIWPHDTAIVAQGFAAFGYQKEARELFLSLLSAYSHFRTPLELFAYDGGLRAYRAGAHMACQVQAWSAGALLLTIDALGEFPGEEGGSSFVREMVESARA